MLITLQAIGLFVICCLAALSDHQCNDQKVVDIAILGGGASGTYAAVTLQDLNSSVVIIERQDHLGGNVNTWIEPETGTPIDFGVQVYWDYGPAKAFFARMGVEIAAKNFTSHIPIWVDGTNGASLSTFTPPGKNEMQTAIKTYLKLAEQYSSFLVPGYWDFPSGDDIPPDLLLPFGEFVTKYGIEAITPLVTRISLAGVGGIRNITTFEVMGMAFGLIPIRGVHDQSAFGPKSQDNSELYRKAQDELKDNILLSSTVLESARNSSGTWLVVQNDDGKKTLIKARRLLVTATPSIGELSTLDLDEREKRMFQRWTPRALYVGIIQTSAIPEDHSVYTISSKVLPDHYLDIQQDVPFLLEIQAKPPQGHGIFRVVLECKDFIDLEGARKIVDEFLDKMIRASGRLKPKSDVVWKQFVPHKTVLMRQSSEDIKGGFIEDLYGLQGYRSTWYTGSLWSSDFSTCVWTFTESLIQRMLQLK